MYIYIYIYRVYIIYVRTRLFDCFIEPWKSPPMAKTAPNGTSRCPGDDNAITVTNIQS